MLLNNKNYHPIFNTSDFFVETPMIHDLANQIDVWIRNGATGGVITGPSRCGKTVAIRHISKSLVNTLGQKIYAYRVTIPRRDKNTVAMVHKTICFSLGLKTKLKATADEMSNLIFHRLAETAIKNDTNQVILFVDEFHRLDINQLEAFAEIYDRLSDAKINVSTFFIGNKNTSAPLIERIQMEENELIRGRFFISSYDYSGLRSVSDVSSILRQYDNLKFPEKNGVSYAQFFAKEKMGEDWNLEEISSYIWDVYKEEYSRVYNLKCWPTQYFMVAVKVMLVDYFSMIGYQYEDELMQIIQQSIKNSGLVPSLVVAKTA